MLNTSVLVFSSCSRAGPLCVTCSTECESLTELSVKPHLKFLQAAVHSGNVNTWSELTMFPSMPQQQQQKLPPVTYWSCCYGNPDCSSWPSFYASTAVCDQAAVTALWQMMSSWHHVAPPLNRLRTKRLKSVQTSATDRRHDFSDSRELLIRNTSAMLVHQQKQYSCIHLLISCCSGPRR